MKERTLQVQDKGSHWSVRYNAHYDANNPYEIVAKFDPYGNLLAPSKFDKVSISEADKNALRTDYSKMSEDPDDVGYFKETNTTTNKTIRKPYIYRAQKIIVSDKNIGAGTFGEIWRAQSLDTYEWYAIKMPTGAMADLTDSTQKENEIFLNKMGVMPDGMRFYNHWKRESEHKGQPIFNYIIPMNLIEGVALDASIEGHKQNTSKITLTELYEIIRICINIIDGVDKIHQAGRVHHDLKGKNIIFQPYTLQTTVIDIENLPKINSLLRAPCTEPWAEERYNTKLTGSLVDIAYDIFSLCVIFSEMLKMFNKENGKHFYFKTTPPYDYPKYDQNCFEENCHPIAKSFADFILKYMKMPNREARNLNEFRDFLTTLAKDCYKSIIAERLKVNKIGILDAKYLLDEKYLTVSGPENNKTVSPNTLAALQGLDCVYVYKESCNNNDLKCILDICKNKYITVRGIIVKRDATNEEKLDSEFPLPVCFSSDCDMICACINQAETPAFNKTIEDEKKLRALNAYFYLSSEQLTKMERKTLRIHNIGFLEVSSDKKPEDYQNDIASHCKSAPVSEQFYSSIIAELETLKSHFLKEVEKLSNNPEKKEELLNYQIELELTKSLIDKIKHQYQEGNLTYQAAIKSLSAYRKEFRHTSWAKNTWCTLFKLEHEMDGFGKVKTLEERLKAELK